jgi:hypothetical protein
VIRILLVVSRLVRHSAQTDPEGVIILLEKESRELALKDLMKRFDRTVGTGPHLPKM